MSCPKCQGSQVLLEAAGELSVARVCDCQEPCRYCNGTRITITTQGGYDVAVACQCTALRERVRCYNNAEIPRAYGGKSLDEFVTGDHPDLKRVKLSFTSEYKQRLRKPKEMGVLLISKPGAGKTHLLTALVSWLTLEQGVSCRFVDFYQLCARIRASFRDDSKESEADILEPLIDVEVLCIDDIGKGQGSAWELTVIEQLITRRYNADRKIIGSTNYLPEALLGRADQAPTQSAARRPTRYEQSLEERIDGRLVSRLRATCDFIYLRGVADYRDERTRERMTKPTDPYA